jgi:aminoglycoside phosphotransferase family enzyme/predicted kinase
MSDRNEKTDALCQSEEIVEFLRQPKAFAERSSKVEVIETHVSWVFLTDRFAYKLKKPVRFDFLDFSTPDLRRRACEEEVRFNRRLAPHIYLGAVPITLFTGRPRVGGKGMAIDWLVKMRRLPADCAVDRIIRCGELADRQVHQIGLLLAEFYQHLPPLAMRSEECRSEIEKHVRDNRLELVDPRHGLDLNSVQRVIESQIRLMRLQPDLLDNRVRDGRIVDGHGDLRPEHIYLAPLPTIIDCVEFNSVYRHLDVADELSFLAMECAALGAEWVGDQILEYYCEESGDDIAPELLAFYKIYRACVRSKVCVLRAGQLSDNERRTSLDDARRYLRLAETYCKQLGPPLLLVVRGLTGTGKSTLATALAEALEINCLKTDVIRRELFGRSEARVDYNDAIYNPQNRERVYGEMFRRAETLLEAGHSVILDGTFLAADLRARADALAKRYNARPAFVRCNCPEEIATRRIAARMNSGTSLSESRPEIRQRQKTEEELDPPDIRSFVVDTSRALPAILDDLLVMLRQHLFTRRTATADHIYA